MLLRPMQAFRSGVHGLVGSRDHQPNSPQGQVLMGPGALGPWLPQASEAAKANGLGNTFWEALAP